jgi:integral membrane protein
MNEKLFIYLGRLEGLSLLGLMFIAMPMKYIMGNPELVKHFGRAHGGLFLAYCVAAAVISDSQNWDKKKLRTAWLFSCLPFGTFIFEKKYMSRQLTKPISG